MHGSALKSPVCRTVCPSGRKKSSMAAPGQLQSLTGHRLDWDTVRRTHARGDDSLVSIQQDDLDSLHRHRGIHGEHVHVLLGHLQFALNQVPSDLKQDIIFMSTTQSIMSSYHCSPKSVQKRERRRNSFSNVHFCVCCFFFPKRANLWTLLQ